VSGQDTLRARHLADLQRSSKRHALCVTRRV